MGYGDCTVSDAQRRLQLTEQQWQELRQTIARHATENNLGLKSNLTPKQARQLRTAAMEHIHSQAVRKSLAEDEDVTQADTDIQQSFEFVIARTLQGAQKNQKRRRSEGLGDRNRTEDGDEADDGENEQTDADHDAHSTPTLLKKRKMLETPISTRTAASRAALGAEGSTPRAPRAGASPHVDLGDLEAVLQFATPVSPSDSLKRWTQYQRGYLQLIETLTPVVGEDKVAVVIEAVGVMMRSLECE